MTGSRFGKLWVRLSILAGMALGIAAFALQLRMLR